MEGLDRGAEQTDPPAVLVFDDAVVDVGEEATSVPAADGEGAFPGAGAAHGLHDPVSESLIVWADGQFGDRPPEGFGARPAVQVLGGTVPVRHASGEVGRDDRSPACGELILEA